MSGYRDNPEANAKAFTHDGLFGTGDQGEFDDQGQKDLTGRIKELILKGGEEISPVNVDNAVLEHEAVVKATSFAYQVMHTEKTSVSLSWPIKPSSRSSFKKVAETTNRGS